MKVVVIGGTRFIGPRVVKYLVQLGHDVTVFHRGRTGSGFHHGVREILGERKHFPKFSRLWNEIAPQVVLDMIPMTEEDVIGSVDTFKGVARRLVAVSSADVYRAYGRIRGAEPGGPDPVPLSEDAPLRQLLYPYRGKVPRNDSDPDHWMDSYEKMLVERVTLNSRQLPGTVLRLAAVYGPEDPWRRFLPWVKRMADNRPALLLSEAESQWRWSAAYVDNVAHAIVLAVTEDRAAGQIYNVAEPESLSRVEWMESIARAVGWAGRIVTVPDDRLPSHLKLGVRDPKQDLILDTTRLRKELGYAELVSRDEAVKRTVEWELAHLPREVDAKTFDYALEDTILAERDRAV